MITLWLDIDDRDGKAWAGHRWDKNVTDKQMDDAILSVEAWVRALKSVRRLNSPLADDNK